ncbi:MAG: tRNA (cytidine(34)-2'-O)-methyltransferase [Halieaceae bacterium]|nr:tRNA (cytidine(34)-2'-O)-methyltransferase [Halieaceae bacterium]
MSEFPENHPSGLHVVLHRPEIPPNTGNIIRLCANTGAVLHVIRPLGFVMDDTRLRRAGLDYHEFASVTEWDSLDDYVAAHPERRLVAIETSGQCLLSEFVFSEYDALLFGSETKGLPEEILAGLPAGHVVRLPMLAHSRSLNLSNAVAVAVYEAWRQIGTA